MSGRIKIGVAGVGSMGKNHVRILSGDRTYFSLQAIYDTSAEQARSVSEQYSVSIAPSYDDMLDSADAVVIAVPSPLHTEYGLRAAERGVHALIEKPIALNSGDAGVLNEAFEKAGKVLMTGHVERFNPVITELSKLIKSEDIIAIESRRYSGASARITDTNVVMDLMIHDIDIVLNALCKDEHDEIESLYSVGRIIKTHMPDFVECILKLKSGILANITASRVTSGKVREIIIHTRDSYITADLLNRTLLAAKNANIVIDVNNRGESYRQESICHRIFVPQIEPLVSELSHFGQCITDGAKPLTDGASALRAVVIAEQIMKNL